MPDIRERIEEDRGLLKKIQLYIPGFRGYRRREDIRDADVMLRIQLADRIARVRRDLEECRGALVKNLSTDYLNDIGGLINDYKRLEGKVRHAESGYSGLVSDLDIKETQLDRLYEYDASLLGATDTMAKVVQDLLTALGSADDASTRSLIGSLNDQFHTFEDVLRNRIAAITGTAVVSP